MSYNPHESEASAAFSQTGGDPFPNPALPPSLEVITSKEPQNRDEKLNHAIRRLIPAALQRGQGILVIQHDYGKYTVRIDGDVPCGTSREYRE
ncbi:hypothetical protein M1D89_00060 (plasmid) [Arthrobacter sp. D3-18]